MDKIDININAMKKRDLVHQIEKTKGKIFNDVMDTHEKIASDL